MRSIFEIENQFQRMLDVEAALARALASVGLVPKEDAAKIAKCASIKLITVEKIRKYEGEFQHETMATVMALSEACGKAGHYVHFGATSNDILDTRGLEFLPSPYNDIATGTADPLFLGFAPAQSSMFIDDICVENDLNPCPSEPVVNPTGSHWTLFN